MSECPFCKAAVHEEATVCRGCGAEKVSSLARHLQKQERQVAATIIPCGIVGAIFGVCAGVMAHSSVVGYGIFILMLLLPILVIYFSKRNKTIWYR
ncbi:hypothetical protein [Erwinia sp. V71]|uniref:hypothetical protein n=1 Tax=Erwinia sp. V71 TaxID=3369424 RepID=UPI003F620936